MSEPLLSVKDLKVHFPVRGGVLFRRTTGLVKAVDGITFDTARGETLGLVGESGCGKSTTGRAILQLVPPTSGSVRFEDRELTTLKESELRPLRRRMQVIFQDPYASLNPRMRVGSILQEPIDTHRLAENRKESRERVLALMAEVGLDPKLHARYPHEFSGGQRQRIGIARALATEPDLVIADEPVSALDVSVQAQVLNLLMELQERHGLAYLFVAHNLAVVRHVSDRVAVMYLGRLVEVAPRSEIFHQPAHPYTQALLSAVPPPDPVRARVQKRIVLEGDVPSPLTPPSGCTFHPRCRHADDQCKEEVPLLRVLEGTHRVTCHHAEKIA